MSSVKLTPDNLLGTRAVAKRLGVHENTVRNWVRHGILKSAMRLPFSGYLRFTPAEADRAAKLACALQRRKRSGITKQFRWWLSDGYVHVANDFGVSLSIPYEEWNEMIDRIGKRYPEADRDTPP